MGPYISANYVTNKIHEIKAPTFPESVVEGVVSRLHKQQGDTVNRDDLIVDIETDKVVLEVVAPADGIIIKIFTHTGAKIKSEEVIAFLEENCDAKSQYIDKIVTPSARKIVSEHNTIDIKNINGTGKGGRIIKEDVQRALTYDEINYKVNNEKLISKFIRTERRVPMSIIRQTIANRLVQVQKTAAILTTYNEVDMSIIIAIRKKYKNIYQYINNANLGFMGFFVKACTEALKLFPDVNSYIDGNEIVYHDYQDISVAVSTPRGLVVPVLRNTNKMNITEIEKNIAEFINRGTYGTLNIEEMTGGTFTITNGGIFGSMFSTPILNPPQTAILGMHNIKDRPIAINGQVVIRPMMYLALSYDHRMIDGKDAVKFIVTVKKFIEDPYLFF
ncbi:Dihydrolipoyllysine-residue succinyltransferase component of 2-oxoglutarate dehydrogenase complex [Candidatus Johnevansia muelleri]|uniref:Dihydrolipoyllysine-residue succinyltransferase component of 2-oxoglutarate dehydrogenase complex n=1 Tax=Candidatus Johnevansia muelleri TaxID=1495769 RepID=A0A078KB47_9GAMM|nr:Dihydrolipoyllysine-residue succinyltransferase component of 2-oxoglutarate dehydrogenase complex [Candidatus Evansia muelleri]